MCKLCEETEGGIYCQNCGAMICFDTPYPGDDICRPAYVTAAGDLYCSRCGSAQDRAEDEWEDENAGYYYDPFDPDPYDNILVITIKEDLDDKN